MTQPTLFDAQQRTKKWVNVPRTSVAVYRETDSSGRVRRIVDLLSIWHEVMTEDDKMPTSAELSEMIVYRQEEWAARWNDTQRLLYVRRGLSDALAKGLVERGPARVCQVSGKKCLTWRIRGR